MSCAICFIGPEDSAKENGSPLLPKKTRNKKQAELDIEFIKTLDDYMADPFVPHKNLKSLLLPESRETCNTTLPEDCHYQPEDLVKLFLLPNVMVRLTASQDGYCRLEVASLTNLFINEFLLVMFFNGSNGIITIQWKLDQTDLKLPKLYF